MSLQHFRVQLFDHVLQAMIAASGGVCFVASNGDYAKLTLYDKDGAAASNPVSLSNGLIEFYTAVSVTSVDLYIQAPGGQFLVATDIKASGPNELYIDTNQRQQVMVIPFSVDDATAAAEQDSGFDEPTGAIFLPNPVVDVGVLDATETIDVGTDSTDSGDANGFLAAVSVATAGVAKGTLASGGQTIGALLSADEDGAGGLVPEGHVSGGKSITYTLSAGSDTAEGFIYLPYFLAS